MQEGKQDIRNDHVVNWQMDSFYQSKHVGSKYLFKRAVQAFYGEDFRAFVLANKDRMLF